MMNDDIYEKLNDYLDGLLPDEERRAFEAQLSADAELRAEADALRSLRTQTDALPREMMPDGDLWRGVAARIGADEVTFRRSRRSGQRIAWWSYGLAAAAVIVLMLNLPTLLKRGDDTTTPKPQVATATPSTPVPDAELQRVTAQYLDARAQLVALLEERKTDIAPETFAVVEENLSVIASAVSEIELALAAEPESPKLERMLFAAYQSEVDLLQQAVKLADNATPGADEPGAAKGDQDAV
jgi:hypothetical protein